MKLLKYIKGWSERMRLIDADKYRKEWLEFKTFEPMKLLDMQPTIQAIPIDRIKQAREEIDFLYRYCDNDFNTSDGEPMFKCREVFEILDKLIAESEG